MNNLVSVIIPAYNAEKFILETINSVLKQTYKDLEIIVVNDGSTDSTLSILEEIKSAKLHIITQKNQGASFAKQVGLEQAKGAFVQYLDADDILSEDKIEIQVAALTQYPNHIAVCSTVHFNDYEDYIKKMPSPYEDQFLYTTDQPAEFLVNLYGGNSENGSMIQPNAFLTPMPIIKAIGEWDSSISPCPDEDGEYFCRAILASEGLIYTKNTFNYYRKFLKKGSLSALKTEWALSTLFKSIMLKKEHLFKHIDNANARKAIAKQLIALSIEAYPKYPNLSKEIGKEVKKLGNFSYVPISGGPFTQKLSKILGWKFARLLQYQLHK